MNRLVLCALLLASCTARTGLQRNQQPDGDPLGRATGDLGVGDSGGSGDPTGEASSPDWVLLPPGTFTMGTPSSEEARQADEGQHEVTLTRAFFIQDTAVTQNQFETVMGWNPSQFGPNGAGTECGGECPVENVSWFDMAAYVNELSIDESRTPCYAFSNVACEIGGNVGSAYGDCFDTDATRGGIGSGMVTLNGVASVYDCEGYRLPTEAEWEYAARAGTTAATYNVVAPHFGELAGKLDCDSPHETLDPIAWFCGNSSATEAVGQLQPNAWGLYDMLGNVWEWCWDWYDTYPPDVTDPEGPGMATFRCARGGSWDNSARPVRTGGRGSFAGRYDTIGGRPVRSVLNPPGFVFVPAGTFRMGSPNTEEGRQSDETQHEVTLTRAFFMQETEVTQGQFQAVMGWNPSWFGPNGFDTPCGDDCPVEYATWFDMVAYTNELSIDEGLAPCYTLSNVECVDSTNVGTGYMGCMSTARGGINSAIVALDGATSVYECEGYRLPTEAEWEYAARAGTATATYNGELTLATLGCEQPNGVLDPIAWFCGNENSRPALVAQLQANPWGLYDMLGNVWEWCWDWYDAYPGDVVDPEGGTGSTRVIRGGAWGENAYLVRAACRDRGGYVPNDRDFGVGGRAVRTAQ